jgi:hypothetical protein
LKKMAVRYHDQVDFVAIYLREAHPTDGWKMASNERVGINVAQPKSIQERCEVAHLCDSALAMGIPILVDDLNDTVGRAYSGFPDRLYLISREGRVVHKSGRGPFGFRPRELEQSLIMLLLDKSGASKPEAAPQP